MDVTMRLAQVPRLTRQMRQGLCLLHLSGDDLAAEIAGEVAANPLLDGVFPRVIPAAPMGDRLGVDAGPGLAEHLRSQLAQSRLDGPDRQVAAELVAETDADGYLRIDLADFAARRALPADRVSRILGVLQGFEPTGVFARDLAECLALQLAEAGRLDPMMRELLANLPLMAQPGGPSRLRAALGCDDAKLADMLAELRRLDPAPGRAFERDAAAPLLPEVRAIRRPDGGWEVEPWAPHLPQIVVREARFARLAARCRTAEELAYLRDRMTAARRYAELLERRRRTVLEVAGEIVKRQARFLDDGAPALRPLSMRTIADALRLHESTVSRTVANKALLAPRGTLPLRAFFAAPARVGDTTGPTHAQLVARIADMIAGEGREGVVLSDATIAQRLQAMGVPIARRTVAKHRGQLGLPTPARRRRELRA